MLIRRSVTLFLLLVLSGCYQGNSGGELTFSGTLELTEHALGARTAGRISSLTVVEGERVKKGQVLALLDRFEQAKKDYERVQSLSASGGEAQQLIEYAELAVDDQQIIAPVDGVVLVKVHEVGEVVSAGTPVIVVGDEKNWWVRIFVPEGAINNIYLNQPATLAFDGLTQTFKGYVIFISPQSEFTPRNVQTPEERVTQAFAVKVALDGSYDNLHPGVAADVTLERPAQKP